MRIAQKLFVLFFIGCLAITFSRATRICAQEPAVPTFRIDASKHGAEISKYIYGLHVARWDECLFPRTADEMLVSCDRDAIKKIKDAGFTLLKYPGGNDADEYVWNSPENRASDMDTDEYAAFLRATGAIGFITPNFGQSPELAADWVRYCSIEKHYNIKLWEIGDEVWGSWSAVHTTGEAYGKKFVEFTRAMRAVDPSIKMAANLNIAPRGKQWSQEALRQIGDNADIISFTFYPQEPKHESDERLLASPPLYAASLAEFKKTAKETLPQHADKLQYCCVGYNTVSYFPGQQSLSIVSAVWLAEMLGTFAETQTDYACFWALHNNYPPRGGDYGILSSDGKNTPRHTYYVFKMLAPRFRGNLVAVEEPQTTQTLKLFCSSPDKTRLTIVVINRDPETPRAARINLENFNPSDTAKLWRVSNTEHCVQLNDLSVKDSALRYVAPPYSVSAIELIERGTEQPENLAPTADVTASGWAQTSPLSVPRSAADNDLSTRWQSPAWVSRDGSDEQWIMLDFKQPRLVDHVVIEWDSQYAFDYEILGSLDGKKWLSLFEEKNGFGKKNAVLFGEPTTLRFLKIVMNRGTRGISTYAIREIEVYAPAAPTKSSPW